MPILKASLVKVEERFLYPKRFEVLIEHLHQDLNQLSNLKLNQALYILNESLLGFNSLLYKYGSIELSKTSCGVNQKGECRVWKHPDLVGLAKEGINNFGQISINFIDFLLDSTCSSDRNSLKEIQQTLKIKKVNSFFKAHK